MPKQFFEIDADGFFIGDAMLDDDEKPRSEHIPDQPIGFFRPRWDGERWIEGDPDGHARIKIENEKHRRDDDQLEREREAARTDNDASPEGLARRITRIEKILNLK